MTTREQKKKKKKGKVPIFVGKGNAAMTLFSILDRIHFESHGSGEESVSTTFGKLIVVDRTCDMISPLLTPSTFEALIDDLIGFRCSVFSLLSLCNDFGSF